MLHLKIVRIDDLKSHLLISKYIKLKFETFNLDQLF
jgi:hypothetical protein